MLFDIDHFKKINDAHGHIAGNLIIQEVAHKTQSLCRESDALFRWGGEEFLSLLNESDLDGALMLAGKL